jgi:peptide/nickel transport system permease protein
VGFVLSAVIILAALTSLVWTPYDGNKMSARERLQGPSRLHPLGTDQYGRDTLSRVMKGAVNSIIVGLYVHLSMDGDHARGGHCMVCSRI